MACSNSNMEKISKKSWSNDEDAKLLKLIEELGTNGSWTLISAKMGNRSGKQCRERYHNHLKSEINKSPFTKEEDELVNELQRTMGNQWAKISKHFNGRSDNAVKNRWHIINRYKNEAPAAATSVPPLPIKKHPLVPKLALVPAPVSVTPVPVISRPVVPNVDLLSLYHSHEGHCHEITDSSRSTLPSSGRRSTRSGHSASSSIAPRFTVTMEQVIARAAHTVSDSSSSSSSDSDNEDSWMDDLIASASSEDDWSCDEEDDVLNYSQEDLSALLNNNVFAEDSVISPREDTEHVLIEETNSLPIVETPKLPIVQGTTLPTSAAKVYDTFSEAALTQREDPQEYEYDYDENESRDNYILGDESDDLFLLFDDSMSICSKASPQYISPQDRFKAHMAKLLELTPRTTPRSPACPNVKRHRGPQPGGSPFKIL